MPLRRLCDLRALPIHIPVPRYPERYAPTQLTTPGPYAPGTVLRAYARRPLSVGLDEDRP